MSRTGRLSAVLAALAVGGCGDSASVALPARAPGAGAAATPAAATTGPVIPSAYAGLGASRTVFARAHQESARGRGRGVPLVSGVSVNPGGRVTAYEVGFNDRPPLSDYERIASAAGVSDLPRDRITVAEGPNCLVYGSPGLKGLIGVSYARVTTTRGATTARVLSAATPTC